MLALQSETVAWLTTLQDHPRVRQGVPKDGLLAVVVNKRAGSCVRVPSLKVQNLILERYRTSCDSGSAKPGGRLLEHTSEGGREGLLAGAQALRFRGGVGEDKRVVLVLDHAGWHTGGEVEVSEGLHLQFLPVNESVANRLLENLDELEEILVQRCLTLSGQPGLIRGHTRYHW